MHNTSNLYKLYTYNIYYILYLNDTPLLDSDDKYVEFHSNTNQPEIIVYSGEENLNKSN